MRKENHNAVLPPFLALIEDVKRVASCKEMPNFLLIDDFAKYICKAVSTRGPDILLLDFPEIGKVYDKCLSTGVMKFDTLPQQYSSLNSELFRCLLSESIDKNGELNENLDEDTIFFTRCLLYLYKKVEIACPAKVIGEAVDEFVLIEDSLRVPSGTWDSDLWIPNRFTFRDDHLLIDDVPESRRLWTLCDQIFGRIVPQTEVRLSDISPKHGPGAVSDLRSGGDKYIFPHWPLKLNGTFSYEEFAFHNLNPEIRSDGVVLSPLEPPARLIAVPKTLKGPRMIASEPTAHQFLQQGLMRWIRKNLPPSCRKSINFLDQSPSREAALLASYVGDVSTVDLSSASDRLSCWTVERAFGANQSLLRALHASRTRVVIDGTGERPDLSIRIKKFAAQGSAVTFPVQSIVYFGLCIAALAFEDGRSDISNKHIARYGGKVRVFGDDIIIPTHAVPTLTSLLHSLQLKVNVNKTHTSGRFRESCGMDAYNGYDVTPCYLTAWKLGSSPESVASWFDVCNNAFQKGLWSLSEWMVEHIPQKIRRKSLVSHSEGDGMRLYTFCDGFVTSARTRFNKPLQRQEAHLLCCRADVQVKGRRSFQDLYQFFVENPQPDSVWVAGYPVRKSLTLVKDWVRLD